MIKRVILSLMCVAFTTTVHASNANSKSIKLQPLQFLVGACWKGTFPDGTKTDTHCYEYLYDGAHIRDKHTVTDGETTYRGETTYSAKANSDSIGYVYFNSFGGTSFGEAIPQKDGSIIFPERHESPDGSVFDIETIWTIEDGGAAYNSKTVYNKLTRDGEVSQREEHIRFEKMPAKLD